MSTDRIAKLQEFLAKDPNDLFTYYALAMEFASQGNVQQAVEILEDLLQRNTDYMPACHQLGLMCLHLNRTQDAIAILRRGIDIARSQNDHHAMGEMQNVLDELENK